MVVRLWYPTRRQWVYCIAWVLLFGLAGSVLHLNRVPTLITAIARRWLALPVQHFFDDFRILEPEVCGNSALEVFQILDQILGIRFDEAKDQAPAPVLIFLEVWKISRRRPPKMPCT